jgi:hypothetical protein
MPRPILSHYCGVEHRSIELEGRPLTVPTLPGVQIDALPQTERTDRADRISAIRSIRHSADK